MLVVGPNRLFLGYIEQVLPVARRGRRRAGGAGRPRRRRARSGARRAAPRPGSRATLRMARVLAKAVRDRERAAARRPASSATACRRCVLPAERTAAHRRRRPPPVPHPQRRPALRRGRAVRGAGRVSRAPSSTPDEVRERLRRTPEVREALERMWPVLTPAAAAARPVRLAGAAATWPAGRLLDRGRAGRAAPAAGPTTSTTCVWTNDDVPLLDEARALLGPRPGGGANGAEPDEVRTYGHIVVDEAQDLSPDAAAHARPPVAQRLDDRRGRHRPGHRRVGPRRLGRDPRPPARTSGRPAGPSSRSATASPAPNMDAGRPGAAPWPPPTSRRRARCARTATRPGSSRSTPADARGAGVAEAVARRARRGRRRATWPSSAPASLVDDGGRRRSTPPASSTAGPPATASTTRSRVVPVGLVKGLELDAAVVVEPAAHRRRGGPGPAGALRRPHPGHQAPRRRPRPGPPRAAALSLAARLSGRDGLRRAVAAVTAPATSSPATSSSVAGPSWLPTGTATVGGGRRPGA